MSTTIIRDRFELRKIVSRWKLQGQTVGLVPTMGALHAGHLSLAKAARKACDRVIVTIFINPKQFNSPADLANYPRTEYEDATKLEPIGADLIYVPDGAQMYPEGFSTNVSVSNLTECLCGAHRPGHFDGVATVVAKLFLQTQADFAYFGEKDFQQLQVVRRMATDLDIATKVIGCPTIRESDGLAMSSRNQNLTAAGRAIAPALHRAMMQIVDDLAKGSAFDSLHDSAVTGLVDAGFSTVEYLELRAVAGLELLNSPSEPARLFAAVQLENVRLIDNLAVPKNIQ